MICGFSGRAFQFRERCERLYQSGRQVNMSMRMLLVHALTTVASFKFKLDAEVANGVVDAGEYMVLLMLS